MSREQLQSLVLEQRLIERLTALRTPPLSGLFVLESGARNAALTAFAQFEGARRAAVQPQSNDAEFRIRALCPNAEIIAADEAISSAAWDVILFLEEDWSRLPKCQIDSLVRSLQPDGLLIIETSLRPAGLSDQLPAPPSVGQHHPSLAQLRQILDEHAFKHLGVSIRRREDTSARHIFHVRRRKPFAYLLLMPPAFGKSTVARNLFAHPGVTLVSGDQTLQDIASGKIDAASIHLRELVRSEFSPQCIDHLTKQIFSSDLWCAWIDTLLSRAVGVDVAIDSYAPASEHERVCRHLRRRGYAPVQLHWEAPSPLPDAPQNGTRRGTNFATALGCTTELVPPSTSGSNTIGHIDVIEIRGDRLFIRGWAAVASERLPNVIQVFVGGREYHIVDFVAHERNDVRRHLGCTTALLGFEFNIPVSGFDQTLSISTQMHIRGGESLQTLGTPFSFGSQTKDSASEAAFQDTDTGRS